MIKNLGLIYRTVKHLKFIQIFYQIFYQIKPKKPLSFYSKGKKNIEFTSLKFKLDLPYHDILKDDLIFTFLNKEKKFDKAVDWNFQDYGKLWNYNLQYFNCLNQKNLTDVTKNDLLISITNSLNQGDAILEPYPVSLRVMNTIRYYSISEKRNDKVIEGLYGQLNYLSQHLEFHLLGNHLLENGFALLMGGVVFGQSNWITKAENLLYKQLSEQILDDGAHFELSPMYHQIILFRLLELIEWYGEYDDNKSSFLSFLMKKAEFMLSWLKQITFSNGDIPHFNDSAFGIAFTSFWLFNFAQKLNLNHRPLKLLTSGYRKYSGDGYECILDVASLGSNYQPGHAHADCLSFVLYKKGKPFIVDVGTSTYEIGNRRDYERSTSAHNTVVVNGEDQSEVWGGFRVGRRAKVKIIKETDHQLEAEHNGYFKKFGINHDRKFFFSSNKISILDNIKHAKGKLMLHFAPNVKCSLSNDKLFVDKQEVISFNNSNQITLMEYNFSKGFNEYERAYKLEVDFQDYVQTIIKFSMK